MKRLLLSLPLCLLLSTSVYAATYEDVLDDYGITSSEELEDILFEHSYLYDDLGSDVWEAEEALCYYGILKDYGIESTEELERLLDDYDELSSQDYFEYYEEDTTPTVSKKSNTSAKIVIGIIIVGWILFFGFFFVTERR